MNECDNDDEAIFGETPKTSTAMEQAHGSQELANHK